MSSSIQELLYRSQAERYVALEPIADPAAGSEISFTCPSDYMLRLLVLRARLGTDATVGTRLPTLQLDDGNDIFYQQEAGASHPASTTVFYHWATGLGFQQTAVGNQVLALGIPAFVLLPGWRLRTVGSIVGAGDDYSQVRLLVERIPARGLAAEIAYELAQQLTELGQIDAAAAGWAGRAG